MELLVYYYKLYNYIFTCLERERKRESPQKTIFFYVSLNLTKIERKNNLAEFLFLFF